MITKSASTPFTVITPRRRQHDNALRSCLCRALIRPQHRKNAGAPLKTPHPCAKTRRSLVLQASGALLSTLLLWPPHAVVLAEEGGEETLAVAGGGLEPQTCDVLAVTKSVFFDVSIDGSPAGRIVVGLYGRDAPAGAARFADLAAGRRGVGYRKKEFVKVTPSYVQNAGIRSFGVDAEIARGRALRADELIEEALGLGKRCQGSRTFRGAVGLIVRDPTKPPSQIKLVAKEGKIEVREEEVRPDPNGTEFVIATKDAPELESSTLLIGRVVEGMDVVDRIGNVKAVQENTKSPYFQVAKLIGDKRAVVAERGFNRPYAKIVITKCGELP